jgi:hypothetical protein
MNVARLLLRLAPLVVALFVAGCAQGGTITVNDGGKLACTGQVGPALDLRGRLDQEAGAERVQLTYAAVVNNQESPFPGLLPIAIPLSDPASTTVDFRDDRTRAALCQQMAFDTFTADGERSFVVRMLRERDQNVLAEGRFSIMMAP